MLEETLKNINSNLERIAKVLESKVNSTETTNSSTKMQESTPEVGQATIPAQPLSQQPMATEIPQTPVAQPVIQTQSTIPTTPVQQSFTQEQLAVAMSRAVTAGKMNIIQGILQQFNVQALTQINPADYNKVASMLKEAGVEV